MSNIDKRALREAAERAGQNDWEYVYTSDLSAPGRGYITVGGAEAIYCLNRATGGVKQSENVLRYIAAARPEKMLALLDELEAAEKRIAELEALTASMEQEPVAYTCIDALDDVYCGSTAMMGPAGAVGEVPLYAAPQLPQPAVLSVPDGVLKSLLPDAEKPDFWFEHNGKIFFEGVKFNNAVFEACRAAMLQGAEPVTTAYKLPDDFDFDRFNDVVWLETVASNPHMHSPTTSTIAMVALELNRKLAAGNSPVIPDGWVACGEQMPEDEQEVIVQNKMGYRYVSYFDEHSGLFFDMRGGNQMNCIEHIFVTHWMPMPAAPQQEA